MNISVTFRNTEAEEWLKEYVHKKLSKLDRYIDKPADAQVTLSVEKFRNVVEVKLLSKGIQINGKEEAKEMILAVDMVTDKIERQIKKHKDKIRNRKDSTIRAGTKRYVEEPPLEMADDEPRRSVEVKKVILRIMSADEAMAELERSGDTFIIYRDSVSENIHVIHHQNDGNYVLMETIM